MNEGTQNLTPNSARVLGNMLHMKGEQEMGAGQRRNTTMKSERLKAASTEEQGAGPGESREQGVGLAAGQPSPENPGPPNNPQGSSDLLLV